MSRRIDLLHDGDNLVEVGQFFLCDPELNSIIKIVRDDLGGLQDWMN